MKIALVHDFLTQIGGAEKVLEVFHNLFPRAPVFTLVYDKDEVGQAFDGYDIRTSFIQRLPGGVKHYKWYLTLMPTAIEQFDLTPYDIVLSDSSAYSKGVITRPETLHVSYCHSPTRYLWNDTHRYTEELKQPRIIKSLVPSFLHNIRMWDYAAAARVDRYIANSRVVGERIKKYYNHESEVIYPPVEVNKYKTSKNVKNYFLIVSRLRPYKRVDLAIEAFNALDFDLKIIGTGEEYAKLKKMAKRNIEFLGPLNDDEKRKYMSECLAFINPQEEDFGITAVEAMASGRPVIAYRRGGARETIKENVSGVFFDDQNPWSLVDVVRDFDASKFDSEKIRETVLKFDTSNFTRQIKEFIDKAYIEHKNKFEF